MSKNQPEPQLTRSGPAVEFGLGSFVL